MSFIPCLGTEFCSRIWTESKTRGPSLVHTPTLRVGERGKVLRKGRSWKEGSVPESRLSSSPSLDLRPNDRPTKGSRGGCVTTTHHKSFNKSFTIVIFLANQEKVLPVSQERYLRRGSVLGYLHWSLCFLRIIGPDTLSVPGGKFEGFV